MHGTNRLFNWWLGSRWGVWTPRAILW